MSHTSGSWYIGLTSRTGAQVIYSEKQVPAICRVEDNWDNARLIIAAPVLLAALQDLQASVQKWAPFIDQSRARAAIAKATGESK